MLSDVDVDVVCLSAGRRVVISRKKREAENELNRDGEGSLRLFSSEAACSMV